MRDAKTGWGNIFAVLGSVLYLPFILGYFFPLPWWSSHFAGFLSLPWNLIFLLLPVFFIMASYLTPDDTVFNVPLTGTFQNWQVAAIVGLVYGLGCYHFPMVSDYYGNARTFIPILEVTVDKLPHDLLSQLFSFKFEPEEGRKSVMLLFSIVSYAFQIPYQQVFGLIGALCGGLFIFLWIWSVFKHVTSSSWHLILILVGMTTPFMLVFFGHLETYSVVYLLLLSYLLSILNWYDHKKLGWLILMLALQIIGLRLHALFSLMLPALVVICLYHFGSSTIKRRGIFHFPNLIKLIYVPICMIGLGLYIFVFKDYNDPRILENFQDIDRLFLPIFSPDPPWNRYNLLSWNHVFDFAKVIILWSPSILFVVSTMVMMSDLAELSRRLDFSLVVLSLLLFGTFFFVFNPLMSMPMDWDLLVFPVPILLVTALCLGKYLKREIPTKVMLVSVGLLIATIPTFILHRSTRALSERIEQVGLHVFKTYYGHSSTYLLYALQMIKDEPALYLARKRRIIEMLRDHALPGQDKHFALLLLDDGLFKLRSLKEYQGAIMDLREALYYDPLLIDCRVLLVEAYLELTDYEQAWLQAVQLIKVAYPNEKKALELGIRCALKAHRKEDLYHLTGVYLALQPDHHYVNRIRNDLELGVKVQEIEATFEAINIF